MNYKKGDIVEWGTGIWTSIGIIIEQTPNFIVEEIASDAMILGDGIWDLPIINLDIKPAENLILYSHWKNKTPKYFKLLEINK
jgi:hypothetical protein